MKAFQAAKEGMVSSLVLVHYDPSLPIKVTADASAYGLGAVISNVLPDQSKDQLLSPLVQFSHSLQYQLEGLRTDQQRSLDACVLCNKVSSVPLREKIYSTHQSQAASLNPWI